MTSLQNIFTKPLGGLGPAGCPTMATFKSFKKDEDRRV